jgi:hypothetical protein
VNIIIVGNPVQGFKYEGPFASDEDAETYGDKHHFTEEWWVVELVLEEDE